MINSSINTFSQSVLRKFINKYSIDRKMKIVNPGNEDYHMHSMTYSDGLNTIDEIVKFAGDIGLKKIAITDHSDATLRKYPQMGAAAWRSFVCPKPGRKRRWENVYNKVEVVFGIEGDLLNKDGDICEDIQGIKGNFLILSAHGGIYDDEPATITEAYLNALKKHHSQIDLLGHPCITDFQRHLDIEAVTKAANQYQVPLEFNCANLVNGKTNMENLRIMLQLAERIYVNSDAHTMKELRDNRKIGYRFLRENHFIK